MRILLVAVAIMTGCSSFDYEVDPAIVQAHITVHPTAPTQLATIGVTIQLVAGSRADRSVALDHVALRQTPNNTIPDIPLDLAFAGAQQVAIHPGEQIPVDLVNVGTTNADLTPLCGATFDVVVFINYVDDPTQASGNARMTELTIACP
jgi:hypothetical protein